MSELINNSDKRKAQLKERILKLHQGGSQESVRLELMQSLKQIPYGEVVEVEQELISEGLPEEEVLKLCDAHSAVLQGNIDLSGSQKIPDGHPVDLFNRENEELKKVIAQATVLLKEIETLEEGTPIADRIFKLRGFFNNLMDVDKHYQRKEYLLFPYLEAKGITGPPKVMWGKHDEIRELIKGSLEILHTENISAGDLTASAEIVLKPALFGIEDMTVKEEQILFPMAMDKLTEAEWFEISRQSLEIGFCLYDPQISWKPSWAAESSIDDIQKVGNHIQLLVLSEHRHDRVDMKEEGS